MDNKTKMNIKHQIKKTFKESFSLYNKKNINNIKGKTFGKINNVKRLKKHSSCKESLNNKFFKLLSKNKNPKETYTFFPNIIDKNTFNFNLEDENTEILRRTLKIKMGNQKHLELCKISNRNKIEKMNSAKEFRNKMKMIQNNIELIKKKNLEEKKKMKELISIRKINKPKKNIIDDKLKKKKFELDKNLDKENNIIKNKYNEIMKRVKQIK